LIIQVFVAALRLKPSHTIIPYHRVVAANGKLGGFSAPGRRETKRRPLSIEGVRRITSSRASSNPALRRRG